MDVWGLGVILYTLLVESSPFDDGKFESTIHNVKYHNPHLPSDLSQEATHLINGMLQKKEENRFSLDQVMSAKFFQSSTENNINFDSGIGTSSNLQYSSG